MKSIGNFLFEKEHYSSAIKIFHYLAGLKDPEQEIIEKLAYSYQILGNFSNALEYYRKAEIFESNRLWSIKKMIFCLRKLNDADTALRFCTEALGLEPEDVYLHTMAGNCYLDKHDYSRALEHYFQVEFLAPENRKVLRPISWCCFVQNKLEMAKTYMERIVLLEPGYQDMINAGHIEYCLGNRIKAMEYYRKAISGRSLELHEFKKIIEFDSRYLINNGVAEEEIPMISDFIRYF
jgi:tetratricopeptide (TPR) repeat protein